MDVPVLTDGIVRLDELRPDDVDRVVRCEDDAIRWAWFAEEPLTAERASRQIEKAREEWGRGSLSRRFAIRFEDDSRLIGSLYLHPSVRGGHLLDIWVCPEERGQDVGTRAIALACVYAFDECRIPLLGVEVRHGNQRARRLAEHLGFEFAQLRQLRPGGPMIDYLALSAEDWWAER